MHLLLTSASCKIQFVNVINNFLILLSHGLLEVMVRKNIQIINKTCAINFKLTKGKLKLYFYSHIASTILIPSLRQKCALLLFNRRL